MRGLGKLVLVLLTGIALFSIIPINLSPKSVRAQSGDISIDLSSLEVRVVKTDGSVLVNPQTGVITSETAAAYFNKIKLVNNTSRNLYNVRLLPIVASGTAFSQCAGANCNWTGGYIQILAGQTYTVPDNSVGIGNIQSLNSTNYYTFKLLAMQGLNSFKLKLEVRNNDVAATSAEKDQILKWSAVRMKLLDSSGSPMVAKSLFLYRAGATSYDNWQGGVTDAQGQVGAALLEPASITYTAKTGDPYNLIPLSPPVDITGTDFQDLTFNDCGAPTGHNPLVDRAYAADSCAPDLVLDTSDLKFINTYMDGSKETLFYSSGPAKLGSDIKEIEVYGLRAKNVGNARAIGKLCYQVHFSGMSSNAFWANKCREGDGESVNLGPNGSKQLPSKKYNFAGPYGYNGGDLRSQYVKNNTPFGSLQIDLDVLNVIAESNESNNRHSDGGGVTISMFKVRINGLTGKRSGVLVKFMPAREGLFPTRLATTNADGVAYLLPLNTRWSPTGGYREYKIQTFIGGRAVTAVEAVTIDVPPTIKTVDLNLSLGHTVVTLSPKVEFAINGNDYLTPSSGSVVVRKENGQIISGTLGDGLITFNSNELGPGTHQLIKATASYKHPESPDKQIDFSWPEKTRQESGAMSMTVSSDLINRFQRVLVLGQECQPISSIVPTQYCVYDDPSTRKLLLQEYLPLSRAVITHLQQKPGDNPMPDLGRVVHSPDPKFDGGYFMLEKQWLVITSYAKTWQKDITYHEAYHFIDFSRSYSFNPSYKQSVRSQLSTPTGRSLWNIAGAPFAYGLDGGYTADALRDGNEYKYIEAFAEEKTATCLYRSQVMERLANIKDYWRTRFPNKPVPADLISQRDNFVGRLNGRFQDATIKGIAEWHNFCLTL